MKQVQSWFKYNQVTSPLGLRNIEFLSIWKIKLSKFLKRGMMSIKAELDHIISGVYALSCYCVLTKKAKKCSLKWLCSNLINFFNLKVKIWNGLNAFYANISLSLLLQYEPDKQIPFWQLVKLHQCQGKVEIPWS